MLLAVQNQDRLLRCGKGWNGEEPPHFGAIHEPYYTISATF